MESQNLMSSEQVAEYIGLPIGTLHQWAYLGKGPTYMKIGRHRRYRRTDVERWLEQCEHTSSVS